MKHLLHLHRDKYKTDDGKKLVRCWVCAIGCFFKGHVCVYFNGIGWGCVYCRKKLLPPIVGMKDE